MPEKFVRLLSFDNLVKVGFALVMGIIAWANMGSNISESQRTMKRIEDNQIEQFKEIKIQRDLLQAQIEALRVDLAILRTRQEIYERDRIRAN